MENEGRPPGAKTGKKKLRARPHLGPQRPIGEKGVLPKVSCPLHARNQKGHFCRQPAKTRTLPLTMTYVISHTTALEVMRARRFCDLLAHRDPHPTLPTGAPGAGEVERWLETSPIARQLSRPVVLLAAGEGSRKRCRGFEVRTAGFELPPASLIKLDEATSIVSPEPLLLQMARIATPLELAMLVCELCGLYAIQPGGEIVQREVPLTSIGQIVEFLANLGGIPGAPALRRAASAAFELSASPQESKLAARVAWDRARGGYAIPILGMNESLEVRRISRRLDEAHVRRPDVILRLPGPGGPGIGLEYNGSDHLSEGRQQQDALRANELLAYNFKPYAIWKDQYQSTSYMDGLMDGVIRSELGLPRHRPSARRAAVELARREALLAELNAIDGLRWGASASHPTVIRAREAIEEARERPLDQ